MDKLKLNETGLGLAFKLELDLQTSESLRAVEEVGLRVVVHDQDETPLQTAGFVISPGFQSFVEISVRQVCVHLIVCYTKTGENDYISNVIESTKQVRIRRKKANIFNLSNIFIGSSNFNS